jgi:uncharacterized membrane protein
VTAPATRVIVSQSAAVQRLTQLADGVFAIVMTLLVLDLRVPNLPSTVPDAVLNHQLRALLPNFASFVLSFVLTGIYWIGHHVQFLFIRRTDRTHLWINLFFLLTIAIVPFSAAVLGKFGLHLLPVMWYGGNILLAAFGLHMSWLFATHGKRLVDADIDPAVVRRVSERLIFAYVSYGFAMLLALVDLRIALVMYLVLPVFFIIPGALDRHWVPGRATPNQPLSH